MVDVYIALGSNLNGPVNQLNRAIHALKHLPKSSWQAVSAYYQSCPMGPQDQPDYINAVARLETRLAPLALFDFMQRIERRQGRPPQHSHWEARTLDLDLLLYGQRRIRQKRLIVPHYGLVDRDFVVIPLLDVAEEGLYIPGVGRLSKLKQDFRGHQLKKIKQHV